ncbi:4-(cytidine 5'-diphospho)-2-C-methyl-D-erythritol kinase [Bacteroidota bacterium]
MISYPNAKVNLGLNITRKRDDGFHEIESVFYPVPWRDILEIVAEDKGQGQVTFTSTGIDIPSNGQPNLCEKVYQLLHERYGLPSVKMHLHKIIPIGAGLGGGSADAAFAAKMLNDLFELGLADFELENIVAQVGSDCPFFIKNTAAFVTGRGEELEPFELNLSGFWIALVNPNIHIGTKEAYAGINPTASHISLKDLLLEPVASWKKEVKNDFEKHLFIKYPQLPEIKARLYQHNAVYAAMTGSGSTVFGLFKEEPKELDFVGACIKVAQL